LTLVLNGCASSYSQQRPVHIEPANVFEEPPQQQKPVEIVEEEIVSDGGPELEIINDEVCHT